MIILSDGADTVSPLSMDQVLWKVRRSDAALYAVQGGGVLGRRVLLGHGVA